MIGPCPRRILLVSIAFTLLTAGPGVAQQAKKKQPRPRNPGFAEIEDDPALPRVLLIGDSISIGYTVPVREALKGTANLHRIPINGGPTTRGLENIDAWLGEKEWDVIHFNWGLHDLKYIEGKKQVPLEEYKRNLARLVARLKQTGAKLIWCSTTPVPEGVSPPRTDEDVLRYNRAALRIMEENEISVNDLYGFARGRLEKIQRPHNVHFTPEGSKVLAGKVAAEIRKALE